MTFKRKPGTPLYRILSEAVKQSILERKLAPGISLPSARELANQYQLSISTVIRAYEDLSSQGFVVTSPKSGTRVADKFNSQAKSATANSPGNEKTSPSFREPKLSSFGQQLLSSELLTASPQEAGISIPGANLLPTSVWQRLLSKHQNCYSHEKAIYDYSADPFGHAPLRAAIAEYLKRSRGIHCTLEQIVVTAAVRLDLVCRVLVDTGDNIAIENPCFPAARKVFLSHGAEIHPIHADDEGLNPTALFTSNNKYQMLYLSPSHQDPSGVALTLERRLGILDWSQRTDTIIFENDLDCNYYYSGTPLPAIQSLRENDTVIYSGSFWLTLGPLASSGFLVLPQRYIPAMRSLLSTVQSERPVLENYALTEFIAEGYLERYIHKQRTLFSKIRQTLIYELTLALRQLVEFKESSGMHMLLQFAPNLTEKTLLDCATEAGLTLKPTRPYYVNEYPVNEFVVPFAQLDAKTIPSIVKIFSSKLLAIC
ncbi:MAG: PLP-dependent aminotransferase family protein [Candidatus Obscuribacterales bacterium]|nr:PLP-dependent aminotransferase family protein [Candidatus Obscuribacterales bacterium]